MHSASYKLDLINDRQTIVMPGTALQVDIYYLASEPFVADTGKVQFYGRDHDAPVAFEASWDLNTIEDIAAAIQWFARYLGQPDMDLDIEDPRPVRRLSIVR